MKLLMVLASGAVVLGAWKVTDNVLDSRREREEELKRKQEIAALVGEFGPRLDQRKAMVDSLAASDDGAPARGMKGRPRLVLSGDASNADWLAIETPGQDSPLRFASNKTMAAWRELREATYPGEIRLVAPRALALRYAVLVRTTLWSEPQVSESSESGKLTFEAGNWEGTIVVADLEAGDVVVRTNAAAESSRVVSFRERRNSKGDKLSDNFRDAAKDDLRSNVRESIRKALQRATNGWVD